MMRTPIRAATKGSISLYPAIIMMRLLMITASDERVSPTTWRNAPLTLRLVLRPGASNPAIARFPNSPREAIVRTSGAWTLGLQKPQIRLIDYHKGDRDQC